VSLSGGDHDVLLIAQIEDALAVENIDEILAVEDSLECSSTGLI
jgi:2-keto-3-deoxy-L-rhamnonate aldolase RhmA